MRHSRFAIHCLLALIASLVADLAAAQDAGDIFEQVAEPWMRRFDTQAPPETGAPLETDRASYTPAITTTRPGRIIYESSYSFIQNRNTFNNHSYPEIISRVGLTERLELRVGWNYEIGGGGEISNGDPGGVPEEPKTQRDSQMVYGFKYALTKQSGWMPQSAAIVEATTPTSGPNSATSMNLAYVWGWTLPNEWQLASSFRYIPTTENGNHFNQYSPSIVLNVPVAERWIAHGEYFGIFTDGRQSGSNRQYFSPGLRYLITPNLEIGARVGWGLTQDSANFFSNVGFGIQF